MVQSFITVFFLLPFFLGDPMFPTIQIYSQTHDSFLDIAIKSLFFPLVLLILLRVCRTFSTLSDTVIVTVTLTRLIILTPLHMFLCLYCAKEEHQCQTEKNIFLPMLYNL